MTGFRIEFVNGTFTEFPDATTDDAAKVVEWFTKAPPDEVGRLGTREEIVFVQKRNITQIRVPRV